MPGKIVETNIRRCGKRVEGGLYVIGGGESSDDGILALFNTINPPIPYQVKLHRGPRIVNANSVLSRMPIESWWSGSSKDTEEKKSADEWAINTFGMTLKKRLNTGETYGVSSADEAMAVLVSKVKLNLKDRRLADYFRRLTVEKIQELPRVGAHYNTLHEHLVLYAVNHTVGNLMEAQAAVWRIAFNLPPTKRTSVIPDLTRILVLMNLPKDARAMYYTFKS